MSDTQNKPDNNWKDAFGKEQPPAGIENPDEITREAAEHAANSSGFIPGSESTQPAGLGVGNTITPQRHKSGKARTANFTVRTYNHTIEKFYTIAKNNNWGLGETLENLVDNHINLTQNKGD